MLLFERGLFAGLLLVVDHAGVARGVAHLEQTEEDVAELLGAAFRVPDHDAGVVDQELPVVARRPPEVGQTDVDLGGAPVGGALLGRRADRRVFRAVVVFLVSRFGVFCRRDESRRKLGLSSYEPFYRRAFPEIGPNCWALPVSRFPAQICDAASSWE